MDYRVKRESDLYVVEGDIPIVDSECLGSCWSASIKSPVYDWKLAEALGASMVLGSRQACNAKREALGLPSLDAYHTAQRHDRTTPNSQAEKTRPPQTSFRADAL